MKKRYFYSLLLAVVALSCRDEVPVTVKLFAPSHVGCKYRGRIDTGDPRGAVLISSAANVSMEVGGTSCVLLLRNDAEGGYNYFSVELDGRDLGRTRIGGDSVMRYSVPIPPDTDRHRVAVFKSTEPFTGNIIFCGVECDTIFEEEPAGILRIEFIGNSITCGMSADQHQIPCGQGNWYDQHNAYCAYGSVLSRMLGAEYMLSAASGCGIYRHWNRDHPTIPELYEQMYMDNDTSRHRDFTAWTPDIVSICLGTNDLSDGDGVNPREAFDAGRFTKEYIAFVERIYTYYPAAHVVLLSSPMLHDKKAEALASCLRNVKTHFDQMSAQTVPIELFFFSEFEPNGCGYHPDCEDHARMAAELLPFMKAVSLKI